jgi:hypothetical protein
MNSFRVAWNLNIPSIHCFPLLGLAPQHGVELYLRHRSELINYATGILGCRSIAEDVVQQAEVAGMPAPWADKPALTVRRSMDEVVKTAEAAGPDMLMRLVVFPGTLFPSPSFMVYMRGQPP